MTKRRSWFLLSVSLSLRTKRETSIYTAAECCVRAAQSTIQEPRGGTLRGREAPGDGEREEKVSLRKRSTDLQIWC